jgi:glycosyltransferase involved in cell wall biosynthesis
MHIMHLVDNFYPVVGGLERAVLAISRYWESKGHTVSIVTAYRKECQSVEKLSENITVYRLKLGLQRISTAYKEGSDKIFFPTIADPEFMVNFSKLIKILPKIDIAHAHGWIVYSSINILYKNNIPVILGAHDQGQVCAKKTLLYSNGETCEGPSYVKCLNCAKKVYGVKGIPLVTGLYYSSKDLTKLDANIAISNQVASTGGSPLKKYRKKLQVIPTFINSDIFNKIKEAEKPQWCPETPYIFFSGALGKHKGVDILIKAHKKLLKENYNYKLVLAGIPKPDEKYIASDDTIIVLNKPHEEILGGLKNSTVAVVPSVNPEALGQTAIEALACGIPLVATNQGGLLDVTENGKYGFLVKPNDVDSLYEGIKNVIDNLEEWKKKAEEGKTHAEKFTLKFVGPQLEELYLEIIEKRKRQ